jgi:hypothetical protein
MGILVRAKAIGYYDNKRWREGQTFELNEKYIVNGRLPKWVERVDADSAKPKSVKSRKPEAEVSDEDVI